METETMRSSDKRVIRAALACILTPLLFGALGMLWTACTGYIPEWYTCEWQATTALAPHKVEMGKTSVPAANLATAVQLIRSIVVRTRATPESAVMPFKYDPTSVLVNSDSCSATNCYRKGCVLEVPQGITGAGGGTGVPVCSEVGGGGGGGAFGSGGASAGFGGSSTSGLGGSFGTGVDSTGIGVATATVSGAGGGA